MKYRVTMEFIGSTTIEVEADDEEQAMARALDRAPQNSFGFAAFDAGEWYVPDDAHFNAVQALTE